METRREFIDSLSRVGIAGAAAPMVTACAGLGDTVQPAPAGHYDMVVIGTGFGGSLTALTAAFALEERLRPGQSVRILLLERGTWWTTANETLLDKQVKTRRFLIEKGQPTQEWSSVNDFRGIKDLVRRCTRSERRPHGLYELASLGTTSADSIAVLRASGVGGGSLVYSKILMRPPETLFDDTRWPGAWHGRAGAGHRKDYFKRALVCITRGVETLRKGHESDATGLDGPSNILTRAAGHRPPVEEVNDHRIARADTSRKLLRINIPATAKTLNGREPDLIDRARVFQTAMSRITPYYGAVDLSINEMPVAAMASRRPLGNYCERQGRCNIGCLVGAGQTLNKQLMRAMWGDLSSKTIDGEKMPDGPALLKRARIELKTLAEALHIDAMPQGYRVHYLQRMPDAKERPVPTVISADRVVVAAGSLGTSEILLRSQRRSQEGRGPGLRGLSARLGHGFSPNGDHIAFLTDVKERVNLTFGPVTTSFAQIRPDAPMANGFHNIEDQGVPPALGGLVGHGVPLLLKLAEDDNPGKLVRAVGGLFELLGKIYERTPDRREASSSPADMSHDRPESEAELTARLMCVVAQGKDDAAGNFSLKGERLVAKRSDGLPFHADPVYGSIEATLQSLAKELRPDAPGARFVSTQSLKLPLIPKVLTSHPLGGCPMGSNASNGVVDPYGRVFQQSAGAPARVYPGLYVADGSVIPTALGVNPALTISTVALCVADQIVREWDSVRSGGARPPTQV